MQYRYKLLKQVLVEQDRASGKLAGCLIWRSSHSRQPACDLQIALYALFYCALCK